jgi:tetratricopeptide (TPR) repeat protein
MLLRSLAVLVLAVPLVGAEVPAATKAAAKAPTAVEWTPVQQALSSGAADAAARVTALNRAYPAWADGPLALARFHLDGGRAAQAVEPARQAARLGHLQGEAVLAQALLAAGRPREAITVAETAKTVDETGWVRYWGAAAAASVSDWAKARTLLAEARTRGGTQSPKDFYFLAGRLAQQAKDWGAAEDALADAVTRDPSFWDGWYELGRVRALRAELEPSGAITLWGGAENAFAAALRGRPQDHETRVGLARAKSGLARLAHADGDTVAEASRLRDAVTLLDQVLKDQPDHRDANLLVGDAHLHLEEWPAAAEHLAKARALGAKDRALPFNLALALQNAGRTEEATAMLAALEAVNAGERITVGLNAYANGQFQLAARMLADAAQDPVLDGDNAGAAWRFAGHAHRMLAAAGAGDTARDSASASYRQAGNLRDMEGRRFHLALEGEASPQRAYAAGWTWLAWENYLSLPAWFQVIGHYGAAKTHGQGLAGLARHAPLHLLFWTMLCVLPLALFGLSVLRRMRAPVDEVPVPARPASQPPKRLAKVETEEYDHPPRPQRVPPRAAVAGPKDETAATPMLRPVARPRQAVEKAMTMEIPAGDQAQATMKPTTYDAGAGALERKRHP